VACHPTWFRPQVRPSNRACLALCEGQFLDISFEERLDVTIGEYLEMVGGKTAALLGLSAQLGALIGSADPSLAKNLPPFWRQARRRLPDLRRHSWHLGGRIPNRQAGGSDLRRRKKSFPIVYALHCRAGAAGQKLADLYFLPRLDDAQVQLALGSWIASRPVSTLWPWHTITTRQLWRHSMRPGS